MHISRSITQGKLVIALLVGGVILAATAMVELRVYEERQKERIAWINQEMQKVFDTSFPEPKLDGKSVVSWCRQCNEYREELTRAFFNGDQKFNPGFAGRDQIDHAYELGVKTRKELANRAPR